MYTEKTSNNIASIYVFLWTWYFTLNRALNGEDNGWKVFILFSPNQIFSNHLKAWQGLDTDYCECLLCADSALGVVSINW